MEIEISPNGMLLSPWNHDGFMDGIRVRDDSAFLYFRGPTGEPFVVELRGVKALLAEEFREGNIVASIWFICGTVPPAADLETLYSPPHPAVAEAIKVQFDAARAAVRDSIVSGERVLCMVKSSYGCVLVADCKSYAIAPDD